MNISSSDFPQYELKVPVRAKTVRTRYMIAQADEPVRPARPLAADRLLEAPRPTLQDDAKVILYMHGMGSRLEEADGVARALHAIGRERRQNYTVVSMDLPTSGYADKLDPASIAPLSVLGYPKGLDDFDARGQHNAPILDFIEDFVVQFVETLNASVPVKSKIKAVVGGSLGGSMTLRLGRRPNVPWIQNLVSWDPGSIWGLVRRRRGPLEAQGGAHRLRARRRGPQEPGGVGGRPQELHLRVLRQEGGRRPGSSPRSHVVARRLGLHREGHRGRPRRATRELRAQPAAVELAPWDTAGRMTRTPGRMLMLEDTGHSIHDERPVFLAREIVRFLGL